MTGRELRDILNQLPDEDLDLPVHLYLSGSEDGEDAGRVAVLDADQEPYYKGDGPWKPEGRDWSGFYDWDWKLFYIMS